MLRGAHPSADSWFRAVPSIVDPPLAKHLSEGMQLAALCHTEIVREHASFWVAVSSTTESVLGHSPSNTAHAAVVGELVVEF
jgi:hypothetical protein